MPRGDRPIPDITLSWRIPGSERSNLRAVFRDGKLSINKEISGYGMDVGRVWYTTDPDADSLDSFLRWRRDVQISLRPYMEAEGFGIVETVFQGALWWMARTVPVLPGWLQGTSMPVPYPDETSHGSFSQLSVWMAGQGYRTSAHQIQDIGRPAQSSGNWRPRDAQGRFAPTYIADDNFALATDPPTQPVISNYNRIVPWADIEAESECANCDTSVETDEANNGSVHPGWWFVEVYFHNDTDNTIEDAYLCQECWDDSHACQLSGCNVRSQYQSELRGGRRSYRQFCSTTIHDMLDYCDRCDRYIDPDNGDYNSHMERCVWCADNSDAHEDCEACGTQSPEHDEDCECDYCDWENDGADPDDPPESDHCSCNFCEYEHQNDLQQTAYRANQEARARINSYSHKPYYNFFPSGEPIAIDVPNKRLHIGLEIEVSFKPPYIKALAEWLPKYEHIADNIVRENFERRGDRMPGFIFVKSDSTVTNGFEIVTMPFEPEWGLVAFPWEAAFSELITQYGAVPEHTSTGQHIHISKSSFDMAHFWKFFQFHQKLAEFCGMMGGRGTRANYGSFHNDGWRNMKPALLELSKAKGKYDSSKMWQWHPERYSALNIDPATTVEMRYPAGNIEPGNIRKNIQWAWSVFEYTNYIDIKDVNDGALDTPNNFIWWVKQRPVEFADLIKYIERIIPQPKPLRERS